MFDANFPFIAATLIDFQVDGRILLFVSTGAFMITNIGILSNIVNPASWSNLSIEASGRLT